jgi:glycogen phosphorylase
VNVGGHTEAHVDEQGRFYVRWVPDKVMRGVPYDLPISGYRTHTVNTMRLWSASRLAVDGGQPEAGRLAQQLLHSAFSSPAVSSPLSHPTGSDESAEVGLNQVQPQNQAQQQIQSAQPQLLHDYFLISCALQDMLRLHCVEGKRSIATFSQAFSLQLHESQHTLAVAELMRLLLDCHQLDWDRAWQITQATIVYVPSNATAKPLVHWSRQLLQQTLPRHLELIYEINQRFLADVRDRSSGDDVQARHLSLIDDNNENLRMMHLGYVGSHVVINPTLSPQSFHHERLRDFQTLFPDKFKHQESRSISHRSLLAINPPLTQLLIDTLGKHWLHHCQETSA